jgi:flagellar basal-body rod modification protein FlgD
MQVDSVIDSINQTTSVQSGSATKAGSTGYTSSDFMQLLLAQLSNQNPLQPMDDSEMMSQFTQLNSLQEIQKMASSLQKVMVGNQSIYAASLIGKNVSINQTNGIPKVGVVTGFSTENSEIYVQVDNKSYSLGDVIQVWEDSLNE